MSEINTKKSFYLKNVVDLTTLECFINNSPSYTVNYVIQKHKKFQKKLSAILNIIPDHDDFNNVRRKMIQWNRFLYHLKEATKKSDSGNTVIGSLEGFHAGDTNETIFNLFHPTNMSPIKSQINETPRGNNKQKDHVPENYSDSSESDSTEKSPPQKKKKKASTPPLYMPPIKSQSPPQKKDSTPPIYMSSNKSPSQETTLSNTNVGKHEKKDTQELALKNDSDEDNMSATSPPKKKKKMPLLSNMSPLRNFSPPPNKSPSPESSLNINNEVPRVKSMSENNHIFNIFKLAEEKDTQELTLKNDSDKDIMLKSSTSKKNLTALNTSALPKKNKLENQSGEDSSSTDDDEEEKNNRVDLGSIDFGLKEVVEKKSPQVQIKKYSVPKNVTVSEFSFLLHHSLKKTEIYKGFKMESQSDVLDFEVVTALVRRRELILKKFIEARNNGEKPDQLTKKELLSLYELVQERLIEQYKLIAKKYGIEEKTKPLSDLMNGVDFTNSSTANSYYAISGKVKSLSKLVMSMDQLPSPFLIFCLYIQHVILYGVTYGKTGISMCHQHDNVKGQKSTLYCKRYKKHEKNYEKIDENAIMFVGRYDIIELIEPVAIKISSGAGVNGNSPKDHGNKNNSNGNYKGLAILYFSAVKNADPYEVFLFRIVPIVKMDATSIIMYSYIMYMNIKQISPCHLCGKLITNFSKHIRKHLRLTHNILPQDFEGFVSYNHFEVIIMSRAKEFFKIKDIKSYANSLDKIFNDVHAIFSVFNSIGVNNLKSDMSSYKNIKKHVFYNTKRNFISEGNMNPQENVKIYNVDALLRSFIISKDFESSFPNININF